MKTTNIYVKLSKFLSLVLRHKPERIGIQLDENGWTDVQLLLQKMQASGKQIDLPTLEAVVANNDKKRFAFSADGAKIRANQGHSLKVQLGYTPQVPPTILYHGTVEKFLGSIFQTGLDKRKRHHVHLSPEIATATNVGKRRGKPIILAVDSAKMQADGFLFFLSENGVWLTEKVPVKYINRL
ncbi:MAG: RNA 2'-phosphotransferase [Saprospiraceae bacterium]